MTFVQRLGLVNTEDERASLLPWDLKLLVEVLILFDSHWDVADLSRTKLFLFADSKNVPLSLYTTARCHTSTFPRSSCTRPTRLALVAGTTDQRSIPNQMM